VGFVGRTHPLGIQGVSVAYQGLEPGNLKQFLHGFSQSHHGGVVLQITSPQLRSTSVLLKHPVIIPAFEFIVSEPQITLNKPEVGNYYYNVLYERKPSST
jgi:hypothetical protein